MKIFICGDSTAAAYGEDRAPMTGWGQALGALLPGVEVVNAAAAGRSTKSFLAEGRLAAVEKELTSGDVVLIQFGHNDWNPKPERHTEPWTTYTDNLAVFVETARKHGATPVLLTPICMRLWKDGVLQPSHGEYPEAVRALARKMGVPLIDMYEESFRLVEKLGEEGSRALFLHFEKGVFPAFPEGKEDDAHTSRAGAEAFARVAAEGLRREGIIR